MKLKLGLDLDGVVYDFITPFDNFLKKKGLHPDKTKYDRGVEHIKRYLVEYALQRPFRTTQPYPNAIKDLEKLSDIFDFYIITDRNWYETAKEETIKRLQKDGIYYKEIHFSHDKAKYSAELELDFFIEDNVENALKIKNTKTIPFLLNRPYNQKEVDLVRIDNLYFIK